MVGMSCRVLGAVEVVRDGSAVPTVGSQARLVLALLIAERARVGPVDRFVDALSGPSPPLSAVPTVQTLVSCGDGSSASCPTLRNSRPARPANCSTSAPKIS